MKFNILPSKQFYKAVYKNSQLEVYSAGHIIIKSGALEGKRLVNYFISEIIANADYMKLFKKFDGHYAIIIKDKKSLILFVDNIRSYPLFYSIYNNQVFISNKTYLFIDKIKTTIDNISYIELMSTGYITGNRILFKEVKQVECGCYVIINANENKKIKINEYVHFQYRNEFPDFNKIRKEFLTEIDRAYYKSFKKLIKFANGDKIVVPLSGGIDSRHIVYMLYKLNYKNVLCFTYGRENNKEALISKRIAERCNYEWLFIPYSRKMWRNFINSEELQDFQKFAENHNTLSHFQDFFAVKALKKIIPNNSIFVPGHTGDLITGSQVAQLDEIINKTKSFTKDLLVEEIYKLHYFHKKNKLEIKNKLEEFISKSIKSINNLEQFSQEYDCWEYNERQAKYTVNSVRVYEYLGYRWTLPFFYNDILEFSLSVPFNIRYKRKLLLEYLNGKFLFENIRKEKNTVSFFARVMPLFLKKVLTPVKRRSLNFKNILFDYYYHPMQWYGIFDNYFSYLFFSIKNYKNKNMAIRFAIRLLNIFYGRFKES